ncbi:hypothetical protein J40TS1_12900 [Paenibacillus montaniterrae]|uniref:DUF5668 domain-containing protein n=1 Tax=Paenibacillus montaniterrae TaxID=429341 RepID=A0A919YRK1_9BACL|nr:hypothetical protein [Paenibacillus montaniterrae]GIP15648.1 hypothetical protein J40TS1_12900 [Paenibacillus montaniterrae]
MVKKAIIGPVLLLIGLYFLLNPAGEMSPGYIFAHFWPTLFVIPLGLFFHWMHFSMLSRKGVGLLVPGGILLVSGIFCQIAMLMNNWGSIWPGFLLAAAAGLFELYWFGGRNKWLLIPIYILTILSMLFFVVFSIGNLMSETFLGQPILAIVLVLAGFVLMMSRKKST